MYRRVIRKAKSRDNDNYILHAKNKSKAIWRVIHKETGKTLSQKQDSQKLFRGDESMRGG